MFPMPCFSILCRPFSDVANLHSYFHPFYLSRLLQAFDMLSMSEPLSGPGVASRQCRMEKNRGSPILVGHPLETLLILFTSFVIKSILFHINVFVTSITLPLWLLYSSFLLVADPFRALKRARDGVKKKLASVIMGLVEKASPKLHQWLKDKHSFGKLAASLVPGCFWSVCMFFVLSGLLVTAFLAGSLVMRRVVEEPIQMAEGLNLDYTNASPDALVKLGEKIGVGKQNAGWRVVPMNHEMQLTISLTLPESDYNRKLGVFQVKAEFLTEEGKVIATSSHPCMLRYKSTAIRYAETFLRSVPVVAGYSSESQVLSLKARSFTEGVEPTACIRVILQQRAEYKPGAGIPEIYAASFTLESELPLPKRIIWQWRMTAFVWISTGFFFLELMILLACCKPVIFPRARPKQV